MQARTLPGDRCGACWKMSFTRGRFNIAVTATGASTRALFRRSDGDKYKDCSRPPRPSRHARITINVEHCCRDCSAARIAKGSWRILLRGEPVANIAITFVVTEAARDSRLRPGR